MFLKRLVSKKKNRFKEEGFDLDLSYITDRIIAMGFPSEGREGIYRNAMKDVQKFFRDKHENHFLIVNLCSERAYESHKFNGAVRRFPFDDHCPPPITLMDEFCECAEQWLAAHEDNVVAVHCKAGKGRTGCMIACLLVRLNLCATAEEALKLFGDKRTQNGKGVTIPSQMRYVGYYHQMLTDRRANRPSACTFPSCRELPLLKLVMHTVPNFDIGGGCDPFVVVSVAGKKVYQSEPLKGLKNLALVELDCGGTVVSGDVKVQILDKDPLSVDKLCHFNFHTCFLDHGGRYLSLAKSQIDKACKDSGEHFEDGFRVEAVFGRATGDDGVWDDWGDEDTGLPADASDAARQAVAAGKEAKT